jgi:hypothetical protein
MRMGVPARWLGPSASLGSRAKPIPRIGWRNRGKRLAANKVEVLRDLPKARQAYQRMEGRLPGLNHPHSGEMLNVRTWSTGSRGLRALFPEAARPTVSIMTGT